MIGKLIQKDLYRYEGEGSRNLFVQLRYLFFVPGFTYIYFLRIAQNSSFLQKWIALFGQGLEAFAEWRRLDYPELRPAAAGALNGNMPMRFIYPGTEQSLNPENYQAAVANQGPDVLTTKLWFDVK